MKYVIKITILAIALTFLSAMVLSTQEHNMGNMHKSDSLTPKMDMKKNDKNNDGVIYQCPMKCEASDKAGECSKCGMKLAEISVNDINKEMKCEGKEKSGCCGNTEMKDHSIMETNVVHKGTIEVAKIDMNKDSKVYQDMMDWNVISDKPGDCPLCGMKLNEVTLDQAEKNLEKNGFKTK